MPKVRTGTACRWNDERGFGFIKPDDGEGDIFVHRSALGESRDLRLEEGDKVEFEEVFDDRKGKTNAQNVRVIGGGGGGRGGRGGGGRGGRGRSPDSRSPPPRRKDSRSPPPRKGGRGRDDSRDRRRSRSRGR
eukprot:TRINITY_DN34866_c0_g1_i1.p1 TRINITY_DN34866_c0_g1~~TRINITY_DN34866_c0_g1_i1.p1  ORF type:complete len:133 (-),score=17.93 TRINITY_DN34866_c0_g1_i1:121-519(-)